MAPMRRDIAFFCFFDDSLLYTVVNKNVLNEHNTVFASKPSAICNRCFPEPTGVLDANGISIASAVFAGLAR